MDGHLLAVQNTAAPTVHVPLHVLRPCAERSCENKCAWDSRGRSDQSEKYDDQTQKPIFKNKQIRDSTALPSSSSCVRGQIRAPEMVVAAIIVRRMRALEMRRWMHWHVVDGRDHVQGRVVQLVRNGVGTGSGGDGGRRHHKLVVVSLQLLLHRLVQRRVQNSADHGSRRRRG